MTDYLLLAFTNPRAGKEESFNLWYDEQHLQDALLIPGFETARRYRVCPGRAEPPRGYLAVYEITTDDIDATLADMATRRHTELMPICDSFPPDPVVYLFQAIGERTQRDSDSPSTNHDAASGPA